MAWIKSHQDLKDHPKLLLLCQMTGLSKSEAIGHIHMFWWWVLSYAEDGDLSKFKGSLSVDGLKLNDLKACGFVDEDEKVHDWFDFAGRYLIDKYRTSNPKKLKSIVRKYSRDYRPSKVCKITQKIDKIDKTDKIREDNNTIVGFFNYFCQKTEKSYTLTSERKKIIKSRLDEGHSFDQLKCAVDNFVLDEWEDRHKYIDIIYCIGIRNKVDNLEKWLNVEKKDGKIKISKELVQKSIRGEL